MVGRVRVHARGRAADLAERAEQVGHGPTERVDVGVADVAVDGVGRGRAAVMVQRQLEAVGVRREAVDVVAVPPFGHPDAVRALGQRIEPDEDLALDLEDAGQLGHQHRVPGPGGHDDPLGLILAVGGADPARRPVTIDAEHRRVEAQLRSLRSRQLEHGGDRGLGLDPAPARLPEAGHRVVQPEDPAVAVGQGRQRDAVFAPRRLHPAQRLALGRPQQCRAGRVHEAPAEPLLQLVPERVRATYQRHVLEALEVRLADHARVAVRRPERVRGPIRVEPEHGPAPLGQPQRRVPADPAQPDDHDVVTVAHATDYRAG